MILKKMKLDFGKGALGRKEYLWGYCGNIFSHRKMLIFCKLNPPKSFEQQFQAYKI